MNSLLSNVIAIFDSGDIPYLLSIILELTLIIYIPSRWEEKFREIVKDSSGDTRDVDADIPAVDRQETIDTGKIVTAAKQSIQEYLFWTGFLLTSVSGLISRYTQPGPVGYLFISLFTGFILLALIVYKLTPSEPIQADRTFAGLFFPSLVLIGVNIVFIVIL
jgi:hypothetical protein